jgi:tubulin-specific chaperone E
MRPQRTGARKTPTSASFIRPNRISDTPRSFVQALQHKYASEDVDFSPGMHYERPATTRSREAERAIRISGKEVEEVGFDKIRNRLADLRELRIVLLDGLAMDNPLDPSLREAKEAELVTGASERSEIKDACPKVMELDLSRNLFEHWAEIAYICGQLDDLQSLRCDGNRLRDVQLSRQEFDLFESRLRKVHMLSLGENLLPWDDLTTVARLFSRLTTFKASGNALSQINSCPLPQTLTTINLEGNDFKSIADLAPLGALPSLQKLLLRNNRITQIGGNMLDNQAKTFVLSKSLVHLDVSDNDVQQWSFVSDLAAILPSLTSLRISGNPLYQFLHAADGTPLTPDDGYTLTIARLDNLTTLNYSPIAEKDRLNAETYYLSQIAIAISLLPSDVSLDTVTAQHPRYEELCRLHGEPAAVRKGPVAGRNILAAGLVKLNIHFGGTQATTIEVPKRLTVYAVQGLVGRALGLPASKVRLFLETDDLYNATADSESRDEYWDSESNEGSGSDQNAPPLGVSKREMELVVGAKSIGDSVDGPEVDLRVDLR